LNYKHDPPDPQARHLAEGSASGLDESESVPHRSAPFCCRVFDVMAPPPSAKSCPGRGGCPAALAGQAGHFPVSIATSFAW
jgi:hypothetical protein